MDKEKLTAIREANTGKYIALCDGDKYFTAISKEQARLRAVAAGHPRPIVFYGLPPKKDWQSAYAALERIEKAYLTALTNPIVAKLPGIKDLHYGLDKTGKDLAHQQDYDRKLRGLPKIEKPNIDPDTWCLNCYDNYQQHGQGEANCAKCVADDGEDSCTGFEPLPQGSCGGQIVRTLSLRPHHAMVPFHCMKCDKQYGIKEGRGRNGVYFRCTK